MLVAVTLPLGDCVLDYAIISFVPPHTFHVIAVSNCGGSVCWDRWIDSNGQRLGATRACSMNAGGSEYFASPPSPAAQPQPQP